MSNIEESIDVNVPVRTAYNQWTQFEEFPRFMQGVTAVIQAGDKNLQWQGEIGGKSKEWTAQITSSSTRESVRRWAGSTTRTVMAASGP